MKTKTYNVINPVVIGDSYLKKDNLVELNLIDAQTYLAQGKIEEKAVKLQKKQTSGDVK